MKTIAVIFGGRSAEHDVSIITALLSIIKPLELTRQYQVEAVYITKDGRWFWDNKLKDIKLFQSGEIDDFVNKSPNIHILFDNGLTLVKSSQFAGRKQYKKIDVVFPSMHGTYGEDGDLMGLLEMANVPYVGCDVASSAIAMDKVLAKLIIEANGIPTPKMQFADKATIGHSLNTFVNSVDSKLRYPLFVKPAHLGSSIGISQVKDKSELTNAIEVAIHYDDKILVEEAVGNLVEVTLPIIGNDDLTPALLEQPLVSADDFFDFDTKYMNGGKKGGGKKGGGKLGAQGYSQLPADLPKDLYDKAMQVGLGSYKAVGCSGIARVDMLIDTKTKEVYFNEINPLPGSLYAHNWRAAGISSVDLVQKLVHLAEQRWQEANSRATSFSTNYLKQF